MSERGAAALPPVRVPYDPLAEPLVAARARARRLTEAYNASRVDDADGRRALLRDLFGAIGPGALVEPPLRCDYGTNIRAGAPLFLNFDCVILDCAPVRFGDRVTVGPGVHFYAVDHPRAAAERATGVETAIPITVGDDVWIGGRAVIGPGVQVGPGAIVGAAAVVTRDVPAGAKVAGVPARVVGAA